MSTACLPQKEAPERKSLGSIGIAELVVERQQQLLFRPFCRQGLAYRLERQLAGLAPFEDRLNQVWSEK